MYIYSISTPRYIVYLYPTKFKRSRVAPVFRQYCCVYRTVWMVECLSAPNIVELVCEAKQNRTEHGWRRMVCPDHAGLEDTVMSLCRSNP